VKVSTLTYLGISGTARKNQEMKGTEVVTLIL